MSNNHQIQMPVTGKKPSVSLEPIDINTRTLDKSLMIYPIILLIHRRCRLTPETNKNEKRFIDLDNIYGNLCFPEYFFPISSVAITNFLISPNIMLEHFIPLGAHISFERFQGKNCYFSGVISFKGCYTGS